MDFSFAFAANSAVCWAKQSLAELLPLSPGEESAAQREGGRAASYQVTFHISSHPHPCLWGNVWDCRREREGKTQGGQLQRGAGGGIRSALHPLFKEHSSKSSCFSYCPELTWASLSEHAEMKELQFLGWELICSRRNGCYMVLTPLPETIQTLK